MDTRVSQGIGGYDENLIFYRGRRFPQKLSDASLHSMRYLLFPVEKMVVLNKSYNLACDLIGGANTLRVMSHIAKALDGVPRGLPKLNNGTPWLRLPVVEMMTDGAVKTEDTCPVTLVVKFPDHSQRVVSTYFDDKFTFKRLIEQRRIDEIPGVMVGLVYQVLAIEPDEKDLIGVAGWEVFEWVDRNEREAEVCPF